MADARTRDRERVPGVVNAPAFDGAACTTGRAPIGKYDVAVDHAVSDREVVGVVVDTAGVHNTAWRRAMANRAGRVADDARTRQREVCSTVLDNAAGHRAASAGGATIRTGNVAVERVSSIKNAARLRIEDARQPHLHPAATIGELDGIREQVPQDLLQPIGIAGDRRRIRIEDALQAHTLRVGGRADRIDGASHDHKRPPVQDCAALDDAGEVGRVSARVGDVVGHPHRAERERARTVDHDPRGGQDSHWRGHTAVDDR